MKTINL